VVSRIEAKFHTFDPPATPVKITGGVEENAERNDRVDTMVGHVVLYII